MSMCYVGRLPCGCPVAAAVIDGVNPKEVAESVAAWILDGMTIERQSAEWVRENLGRCRCGQTENLPWKRVR